MNLIENIQSSGLLEAYVLGQLSDTERQGVSCLAITYPEIKEEIATLELALGRYAEEYKKPAPAFLKDKIFAQMTFAEPIAAKQEAIMKAQQTPLSKDRAIIPLWSKFAAAASVLLAVFGLWQYAQNTKLNDAQVASNIQLSTKSTLLAAYEDGNNKIVNLAGSGDKIKSAVTVFWNQNTNEVALNVKNLPKPAAGKQYQLWIIDEKGPVDMGMIEANFEGKLLSMKSIRIKPKAFAITLEKEGGVASPTLEQLYVIANV